ncbi:sugar O-acetyltransferase [Aspergillus glaucus CBS 516.65]|uniref:Maltose/galactoside acetyltransferase domain-containing protein n=1 Tax=Aspergillus glaucus CBS 516.65 TaxID=1160497 RepID=A0A1L9V6R0_ASPGL|nr:hypothetical protein ASPGLDRAFT_136581 [Aspergillus glaucus CBS 516.65]OJJ79605.1 hypothetical protein ASPGLDRAFT_136581 [Aspergillus glaucus CBS 516.65]
MASPHKRPEIIALAQDLNGIPLCEQYEAMISGILYNPNTSKLFEVRHHCRSVTAEYNAFDTKAVSYDQIFAKRLEMLRRVVGKVGDGTFVEPPFLPDYGCNCTAGKNSLTILDTSLVIIGDRVQIGTNLGIFSAGHDTSVLSRQKFVEFGHPVFIEDDCWIGGNVVILPDVRVGRGSTIGAWSIVTRDVPAFSVAVESPCRAKKTIPSPEDADAENPYRNLVREDREV